MSSKDFFYTYTNKITACASCHERIINPMFGMEDFDNVGRLRKPAGPGKVYENLQGKNIEVEVAGTLMGIASVSDPAQIEYAGAKDFSNKIAQSNAVLECLVRKGFRFTTGYPMSVNDIDGDENLTLQQKHDFGCAQTELTRALKMSGQSPKALFRKMATLHLVRFRK